MYYSYGTSGFRYDAQTIELIAGLIGRAIGMMIRTDLNMNSLGIIVTASHNPHLDNGVKLIDSNGRMLTDEQEMFLEQMVNHPECFENIDSVGSSKQVKILIARDTRESGERIRDAIIYGIKSVVDPDVLEIVDFGIRTTPEFHQLVRYHSNANSSEYNYNYYRDHITQLIKKYDVRTDQLIIDCANGVGSITLKNIFSQLLVGQPTLICTDVNTYGQLNCCCGSDFMMNCPTKYHELIKTNITNDSKRLSVSIDGDADRAVFYYYDDTHIDIFDGDYLSLLILRYVVDAIDGKHVGVLRIGVVHTGYANGGFLQEIDNIKNMTKPNITITRVCQPTGVKHLIRVSEDFDISIYFEPNGHGSVVVNNQEICTVYPKIRALKELFNDCIGDAVMNIIGIKYIIDQQNMQIQTLKNLFVKRDSKTVKIHVADKNKYVTSFCQTKLLQPIEVADSLDRIVEKSGCRIFVRPSGTEDVLRLYVENDQTNSRSIERIVDQIAKILK
jgi:phosphoacetylglucosamine mutase